MSTANVIIGAPPRPAPELKLGRVLAGIAATVAAFDVCFWNRQHFPGLAMGVFFAAIAAVILFNRPSLRLRLAGRAILALLAGSIFEAGSRPASPIRSCSSCWRWPWRARRFSPISRR